MSPEVKKALKLYLDFSGGQRAEFDRALEDYAADMRKVEVLPSNHPSRPGRVQAVRSYFRTVYDLWS